MRSRDLERLSHLLSELEEEVGEEDWHTSHPLSDARYIVDGFLVRRQDTAAR